MWKKGRWGEVEESKPEMRILREKKKRKAAGWFWMTRSLNSGGSKVKLALFRGGKGVGGLEEGVKARQEKAHCDGKVLGTKEATASVWRCVEQTGPPLSLTPRSGGLATFILPSFLPPTPSRFKRIGSPTLPSPFGVVLKSSERENRELVVLRSC